MGKIVHVMFEGFRRVGRGGEIRLIYQTNPPMPLPQILTNDEAARADAEALCGDWLATANDIGEAFVIETEKSHVR